MKYQLEVCIDNIESLHNAIAGGATRIELCSSLALGGLTPSFGFMKMASEHSTVPVYAMIRPRQGDFLYSDEEFAIMKQDIESAALAQLQGVVLGLLEQDGRVDIARTTQLVELAKSLHLGVTFHRAFDQCNEPFQALESLIEIGVERILTSGLAASAPQGAAMLEKLVTEAKGRVAIMAGAGVRADNVASLVQNCGVEEIHLSGKTTRPSRMRFVSSAAQMGNSDQDDFIVPVTDVKMILNTAAALKSIR